MISPDPAAVNECLLHRCASYPGATAIDSSAAPRTRMVAAWRTERARPEGRRQREGVSRFELAPPRRFVLPAHPAPALRATGLRLRRWCPVSQEFRFGHVDRPAVYRALAQLERDGLVEASAQSPTGRPGPPGLLGDGAGRAGAAGRGWASSRRSTTTSARSSAATRRPARSTPSWPRSRGVGPRPSGPGWSSGVVQLCRPRHLVPLGEPDAEPDHGPDGGRADRPTGGAGGRRGPTPNRRRPATVVPADARPLGRPRSRSARRSGR